MTARSVVLSVLLGAHPAWASAAELVLLTREFDIREPTMRVALTRMVGSGDLVRSADGYRLSDRLLRRQRRQDDALDPQQLAWGGAWTVLVITSTGSAAKSRAQLRLALQSNRFGELREGVWMRPDNVEVSLEPELAQRVRVLCARDERPAELAAQLWDLRGWAATGRRLLADMQVAPGIPGRFPVAAAMVRHLLTDPVLPDALLPAGWPGAALRSAYHRFAAELVARRDATTPGGTELKEAT